MQQSGIQHLMVNSIQIWSRQAVIRESGGNVLLGMFGKLSSTPVAALKLVAHIVMDGRQRILLFQHNQLSKTIKHLRGALLLQRAPRLFHGSKNSHSLR